MTSDRMARTRAALEATGTATPALARILAVSGDHAGAASMYQTAAEKLERSAAGHPPGTAAALTAARCWLAAGEERKARAIALATWREWKALAPDSLNELVLLLLRLDERAAVQQVVGSLPAGAGQELAEAYLANDVGSMRSVAEAVELALQEEERERWEDSPWWDVVDWSRGVPLG